MPENSIYQSLIDAKVRHILETQQDAWNESTTTLIGHTLKFPDGATETFDEDPPLTVGRQEASTIKSGEHAWDDPSGLQCYGCRALAKGWQVARGNAAKNAARIEANRGQWTVGIPGVHYQNPREPRDDSRHRRHRG